MSRVTLTFEVWTQVKVTKRLNEDNIWIKLYGNSFILTELINNKLE